jgi:hypothetical protein
MKYIYTIYHPNLPKVSISTNNLQDVDKIKEKMTKQYKIENGWKHTKMEVLDWSGYFINK